VLCIDGGGVRGIVPLAVLDKLTDFMDDAGAEGSRPSDWFDLIVGTSTGGILAVLLGALRLSVTECIDIYKDLSTKVFQPPSLLVKAHRMVTAGAKYNAEQFEELLREKIVQLGHDPASRLSDFPPSSGNVRRPCVAVIGKRGNNINAFCFTNFKCAPSRQYKADELLWKVLRATSAAPTFFPSIQIGELKAICHYVATRHTS
jgi:patatin-like phospholipase/acyl hydrolase